MRTKTLLTLGTAAGVLGLYGCGGETRKLEPSVSTRRVAAAVTVVRTETVPAVLDAPGTVQPRNRIVLSSQINGFVREMRVQVGHTVQPGQLLATLDARDAENQKAIAQAGVEEAQAALEEARNGYQSAVQMRAAANANTQLAAQTYTRYQKLFDTKSVSPQELDEVRARRDASAAELAAREAAVSGAEVRIKQVEAKIAQAKAQSGRSEVMVGWTQIKAPAAGTIVERQADPGTAIFPGSPLLVIESVSKPQVVADLPTGNSASLKAGMDVRLRIGQGSGLTTGRVAEIVPLSDLGAHTVRFKVDLPESFSAPNGQFVNVQVPVGTRNALLVPRRAIRETGQLTGLFVADAQSKARFRLVKIAPFDAETVEVLSGLESGESVVTALTEEITDGVSLEIRK